MAQTDELNGFTKRDTNCSYWKENSNLITACKPLSWNLPHVRPLSNVEFLMSVLVDERIYQLNTAIDSDVGYDGAEFNYVCCKYFQSPEIFFFIQYW